jgi:4-amino-4-deoxy-L-arabinose transferase-like glycosyltransferase
VDKIDMFDRLSAMSRLPPLLLVVALWAAIYLPALGLFEIKGEEGRRILPAMAMIESGNYIVPQVGGETYFRKPPLINWLIAGSLKIFRTRNEWVVRLPSVLCVLAAAVAFVTIAAATLGRTGSTIAAVVWLTNLGMLEKGRLVEIEALYISLCALAMIFWLSWWEGKRSPWLIWTVPWIFLGLGWLAKGPTLLLFFYAIVLAVLWREKKWRALLHPAHFIGLLIMMSIFAAWLIPFTRMTEGSRMMKTWSNQFAGRVNGSYFKFDLWITTPMRALFYFLPWLLAVPFLRIGRLEDNRERELARALSWSTILPFAIMSLIPGSAPRYTLPVLTPYCWLMGLAFSRDAFARPDWLPKTLWLRLGQVFVGMVVITGAIGFPIASIVMKDRPKVKNIADKINGTVPASETLYAVDPNYQPFFFYVHSPVKYLSSIEELPFDAHYFVVRPREEKAVAGLELWAPRHPSFLMRVKDYRDQTMVLFRVE